MSARICVVTAGHLSTCPRMLKAADALDEAGYQVRVISTRHVAWAWEADQRARDRRSWPWRVVDYDRTSARLRQLATGARLRSAQAVAMAVGPARAPLGIAIRGYSRVHDELVAAIAAEPADLVYGGTTGALAAVAAGAHRLGARFALDLEDFHSAEQSGAGSVLAHMLAERIEAHVLPHAAFLTAGSPMIAEAYAAKYGVRPRAIHNTFPLNLHPPSVPDGPLKMYWFSQTLGPGRGLDDLVRGIGLANVRAELHLRARPLRTYAAQLAALAQSSAPLLELVLHDPAPPDRMIALAQGYHFGVSVEDGEVLNHRLCLGNKIFTYLAAGVPVLMTATPAQSRLAADLGQAAEVYENGSIDALARIVRRYADDPRARCVAANAARAAAERRWHWEHPEDRGALLQAVREAVG